MKGPFLKQVGDRIGTYKVEGQLGRGCEGDVYLVRDARSGEMRSLKLLRGRNLLDELDCAIDYYRRLARVRSFKRYRCAGILTNEIGVGMRPFLVFDFIPGRTLREHLRSRNPGDPLALIADICDAVSAVHRAGLGVGDFDMGRNVLIERGTRRVVFCDADYGLPGRLNTDCDGDVVELRQMARLIWRASGKTLGRRLQTAFSAAESVDDLSQRLRLMQHGT